MPDRPPHRFSVRIYYEDTDLAGIVYYANYLRFIERGRTEALRAAGIDQARLKAGAGLVFVVRRLTVDYRRPARFDDLVDVTTRVIECRRAWLTVAQTVERGGETLVSAEVQLAVVDPDGRPRAMPADIAEALAGI
ncbi:MAG: tol-pal system-associated acyl-CoA thioesterase [Pseudomonadota bacterium]